MQMSDNFRNVYETALFQSSETLKGVIRIH